MNSLARSLFLPLFFLLDMGFIFFLLLLFFGMPCGHVAYLLRVCIFLHALWACGIPSLGMHILFLFFIARILNGNLEKESHVMAWCFIECMDGCAHYLPVWKYSM